MCEPCLSLSCAHTHTFLCSFFVSTLLSFSNYCSSIFNKSSLMIALPQPQLICMWRNLVVKIRANHPKTNLVRRYKPKTRAQVGCCDFKRSRHSQTNVITENICMFLCRARVTPAYVNLWQAMPMWCRQPAFTLFVFEWSWNSICIDSGLYVSVMLAFIVSCEPEAGVSHSTVTYSSIDQETSLSRARITIKGYLLLDPEKHQKSVMFLRSLR